MQFRLRTLIIGCTVIAIFCALFFATPLIIELPILAMIVLVSPSVWICGACFAKGAWRPFFLGGICAGWLAHAFLMYYGAVVSMSLLDDGDIESILGMEDDFGLTGRIWIAAAFLFPGLLAFLGGGCGVLIYRWCGNGSVAKRETEPSKIHEPYVVVETRMTPVLRPNDEARMTNIE